MDERLYKCKGDCGEKYYKDYLDENGYCESCQHKFYEYECFSCKEVFKYDDLDNSMRCSSCAITELKKERKTHNCETIFWIILIIGIICGLIVLFACGSTKMDSDGNYYEVLGWSLAVYCWVGTFLFDLFIMAIYSICKRLDLIIDKLKDIKK